MIQPSRYRLAMNIRIEDNDRSYGGGSLQVNQEIYVNASDFLEIAKILGQFQELAERIKNANPA